MAQSALKSYYEDLTPEQELALPRPLFERIPGDETQLGNQTFRTPIIAMAMEVARERIAALPVEERMFADLYKSGDPETFNHFFQVSN